MGKCIKCGTNFVSVPEHPVPDQLCRVCYTDELRKENDGYEAELKYIEEKLFRKGDHSLPEAVDRVASELMELRTKLAVMEVINEVYFKALDLIGRRRPDEAAHIARAAITSVTNTKTKV